MHVDQIGFVATIYRCVGNITVKTDVDRVITPVTIDIDVGPLPSAVMPSAGVDIVANLPLNVFNVPERNIVGIEHIDAVVASTAIYVFDVPD